VGSWAAGIVRGRGGGGRGESSGLAFDFDSGVEFDFDSGVAFDFDSGVEFERDFGRDSGVGPGVDFGLGLGLGLGVGLRVRVGVGVGSRAGDQQDLRTGVQSRPLGGRRDWLSGIAVGSTFGMARRSSATVAYPEPLERCATWHCC
jgi:hypothetical protein